MNVIKKRAVFAATLLLMQVSSVVFSFDAVITKNANITKTLLPILLTQTIGLGVLLLGLFVQSLALSGKKQAASVNLVTSSILAGIQGIFLLFALYQFSQHKLLGTKEVVLVAVQFAVLLFVVIVYNCTDRTAWNVCMTLAAVSQFGFAAIVSVLYKNEVFSLKRIAIMFACSVILMLFSIWGERKLNMIIAFVVVLIQAIVTMLKFYQLNRSTKVLGIVARIIDSKPLEQVLTLVILALITMMAITLCLHLFREYQVIGKLAAVFFSSIILFAASIIGSIELEADKIVVEAGDTVDTVEYYLYVDINDPAESLKDAYNYRIGVHYEHSEKEAKEVIEKLNAAAGQSLQYHEVDSVSALLNAYESGLIQAFVLDPGTIDDMDEELEMRGENRLISEEMKIIHTLQLEYVPEQEGSAPDIHQSTNIDPNGDLAFQPFIVYISGIDVYGSITTKSRSDVNVLAIVNPQTKEIALVTTPRGSYVDIPGKTTTMRDKLTHAGNYGVEYSAATLEQLYGINIDFFIRVNFTSMEKIVDLLGGVDACSLYTFTSRFHKYHFEKGYNHMNGSQALAFARERITVTGGDVTRGKHHMELVKAIFAKITTTSVLMNYQSLLAEIQDNFQTNMTMNQIADLVSMQLKDSAAWHITTYATSGEYRYEYCAAYKAGKLSVNILKEESVYEATELMLRVLNGEKIPDPEPEGEE